MMAAAACHCESDVAETSREQSCCAEVRGGPTATDSLKGPFLIPLPPAPDSISHEFSPPSQ